MPDHRRLSPIVSLFAEAWRHGKAHNHSQRAASLAYYVVVSAAPLLVLLVLVAATFLREAVAEKLGAYLAETVGEAAAALLQEVLAGASPPSFAGVAGVAGVAVVVWGASNVFAELQSSLNFIWKSGKAPPRRRGLLSRRLVSFLMILILGVTVLVSLIASTALTASIGGSPARSLSWQLLLAVSNVAVAYVGNAALIAAVYRFLPDFRLGWRDVIPGALLTTLLFNAGKFALGWYFAHVSTASAYGATSSFAAFFLWAYYSGRIFFYGAEFTQLYSQRGRVEV